MTTIPHPHVATVREFSRFYTRRLGTLDEGLLETAWSLTEARVVFELAQAPSTDMAALRATLALDSGYLSRLLAKFDAAGLIKRTASATDGRRQSLSLTAAGRKLYRTLDERSNRQVGELLAPLPEPVQESLAGAMRTVMRALDDQAKSPVVVLRGLRPGDPGWVVQRHGEVYAREYGWTQSFEALVARIVADYLDKHQPGRESAWVAEVDGQRAGCVFCVRKDDETAQLRILLVEAWARGHGLGARLVDECIRFARDSGYRKLVLWTNDVLVAARRIYQAAGFELVREESHHSFGKDLVGQFWELRL
ncbi:bifunctional helix-turn-helix transcriptional regulator/GNAT family N-acetyltransferase [Scleromatobacter humisilvae]|uniref:Helix-turn-helix domain-containing GNAT family N-acetyltransferase n=1 Tax=Scleromatobacter humisilvae TaxID=2897159 RepID=A0A9X2C1P3_9BURK|nr:helix-turn-helix domain-containing GNAT family N-acetyltransferase [Scleromatobacter humisilvae]MCK9687781.1 helix-turn-helix domain-containing GNAT family N-acetyltransferase [Scleromatobacter humisilvae]